VASSARAGSSFIHKEGPPANGSPFFTFGSGGHYHRRPRPNAVPTHTRGRRNSSAARNIGTAHTPTERSERRRFEWTRRQARLSARRERCLKRGPRRKWAAPVCVWMWWLDPVPQAADQRIGVTPNSPEPSHGDCPTVLAGGRVVTGDSVNGALTDYAVIPCLSDPPSDVTTKAR
jgi:hypothetical protein